MVSEPARARTSIRRRWAGRTSLFQFREPAFWAFASIIVTTGLFAIGQQTLIRRISGPGWLLSWVLLLFYALPVVVVVYRLDLYEREPTSLVIGALVWGAVAATTLSILGNVGWGLVVARLGGPEFAVRWTAALTAPIVEETTTAVGVVFICLIARDEIDDVMDGLVYGAMCGLGFALVEDVLYFMGVFGGTTSGVLAGFYVRVVSGGLYGHVLYAGLTGMGIAYFVSRRGEVSLRRRFLVAASLCLAAVVGHFLWDSPLLNLFPSRTRTFADWVQIPVAAAVKGLPLLAFLAAAVVLARRREGRWLGVLLREEQDDGALSAEEVDPLREPRRRRRAVREMRERAGPRAAALLKRLQREQINLAMVRARVLRDDDPDLLRQRQYCKSLRDALLAMPSAAPAGGSAPVG